MFFNSDIIYIYLAQCVRFQIQVQLLLLSIKPLKLLRKKYNSSLLIMSTVMILVMLMIANKDNDGFSCDQVLV